MLSWGGHLEEQGHLFNLGDFFFTQVHKVMFSMYNCCVKARHQQDSKWSLVVCICATLSQVMVLGIMRGFGVLFPVLMAKFETNREKTGKWVT